MKSSLRTVHGGNHRSMAVGNSHSVLELLHRRALISQRQIVEATGMQASTVSNIIRELKDCGIVRESGRLETRGVGAKQVSLEIDASFAWAGSWMIDRKGQQLGLLNAAGHIIGIEKFPLDWGWREVARELPDRLRNLAEARRLPWGRFAGLGICVQGIVNSDTGEVIYSHPHDMEAVPLRAMLEKALEAPVHVERNIPCGAYFEQHVATIDRKNSALYYLLRRHEDFFEHGAGILLNGEVYRGRHSAAGELAIGLFPKLDPTAHRDGKQWDTVYQSFGQPLGMLADFLDVDGVIVSSDDPGLTEKRFGLLREAVEKAIRPIQGRRIEITRSQAGPEGMLIGAGLIVLYRHFLRVVEGLPNRSLQKPQKKKSAKNHT